MSLASGARLGPYEILSALGAGGMGEVYRARDSKLNRDVAIKVLPDSFAMDPERLARFQREALVLASLNHPNIGGIYGLEEANGVRALVLELVEGPTLADRIAQMPIPIDEALSIARQIAEALEAAHEAGIIHRDLKPANIKVRPDGTVKVLDFGLAKAFAPDAASATAADVSQSPTITTPAATRMGVILGTAAYMSPEQAKGKPVDKRTDIWAFGCVLYEMLTGKRAFEGDDVTETLAAIIRGEPDWKALPNTPPLVQRLLRRCLQKNPRERLPDIAMARIEIQEAMVEPGTLSPAAPLKRGVRWTFAIPWILAAILAGALLVMRAEPRRAALLPRSVTRLELTLPAGVELYLGSGQSVALSPDGTRVAFAGVLNGLRQLYVRRLDQFDAVPLRGTERVQTCFFSPDGNAVGFVVTDRTLKKVSLADGLVVPLSRDADYTAGGAWGADDRITFSRAGALWQVPASGGAATPLTTLDAGKHELLHAWPTVVAGGKAIVFVSMTGSRRDARHIEALSVATGQRHVIVDAATFPLYAPSGHLIFFRDGALLAAPFDIERLEMTGPAVRAVENVDAQATGEPLAAVSASGSLVYQPTGTTTSRVVWVSRQGVEQPITDALRRYHGPRLAPDGRRMVMEAGGDLWIQDTVRSTVTRLTSEETVGNSWPVWTPDGKRVVFRTRTGLRWIDTDGSGRSQSIPRTSVADLPTSVSPDGQTLAFVRLTTDAAGDVYVLSLGGEPEPHLVVGTPAYEGGAQFSPDGRWMAYASDEAGQLQVYVRPFPGPDRRWQVSTQGGSYPSWNRNGKELFYRNGNKMMAVDVSTTPELALSQSRLLFEQRYAFDTTTIANYDVSLDGQRFVMVKDELGSGRLNLVLNWFDELTRLAPPPRR